MPKTTPPARVRAPAPVPEQADGVVPLNQVRPAPGNPRKTFDPARIEALAASISEVGLLHRLVVRPVPADGSVRLEGGRFVGLDHFELVDGERRFRALHHLADTDRLGSDQVPVTVRWLSDAEALAAALAANDQREDVPPSERAAGYARLRGALGTDEAVAAATGVPVGQVRGLLRLARLPAWALAAVDAGALPRATAELVARVPGDEARARAAACVLQGATDPAALVGTPDRPDLTRGRFDPLSYRDTKDLIRAHFQVELKGCPFDRKALDLLPAAGACEPCPKRAGNDPEAAAEGVRGDVCLDPDCYRAKVAAHRAAEVAKAAEKGVEEAPIDDGFSAVPKGWCDVSEVIWRTDLHADFPAGPNQNPKREEELGKVLGKLCPQKWLAFDRSGAAVLLVKTAEARGALRELGVLKKADPRPKAAPSTEAGSKSAGAAMKSGKSSGPSDTDVADRAAATAGRVLAEFGVMNFDDLDVIEENTGRQPDTSAVWEAFRFVARFLIRDHITFGHERGAVVERALGLEPKSTSGRSGVADAEKKLADLGHRETLALCVRLAAECELQAAPAGPFAAELLAWAELDWLQLQDQARRELTGGESAEAKVAKAEAEQAEPKPRKKGKGGK